MLLLSVLVHTAPLVYAAPLVYDGAVPEALLGRHPELAPLALTALRDVPPRLGDQALTWCDGPAVPPAALATKLAQAESYVDYLEPEAALTVLQAAWAEAPCLDAVADPLVLSRLPFLTGVALSQTGRLDVAQASFGVARTLREDFPWDPAFSPQERGLFDVAAPSSQRATLRMVPEGPFWLDGRPGREVAAGMHLLQVESGGRMRGALVDLKAGSNNAIMPAWVDADVLAWAGDPLRQGDLSAVLSVLQPDATEVWVAEGGRAWRLRGTRWEQVIDRPPVVQVGRALVAGGAAMAVVGATVAVASWADWERKEGACEAATQQTFAELCPEPENFEASRVAHEKWLNTGFGVGVAGAGVISLGLFLTLPW